MNIRRTLRSAAALLALFALSTVPSHAELPAFTAEIIAVPPVEIGPGEIEEFPVNIRTNMLSCVSCPTGSLGGPSNDQCCPGDFTASLANVPPGINACLADGVCLDEVNSSAPILVLFGTPAAVPGSYTLRVDVDAAVGPLGGRHDSASLDVNVFPFSIAVPRVLSQFSGTTVRTPLAIIRGDGFNDNVSFQLISPSQNISAAFVTDPTTGQVVGFDLFVGNNIPDTSLTLQLKAISGSLVRTIPLDLNVSSAFLLSASPSSVHVVGGDEKDVQIGLRRDGAFTSRINLTAQTTTPGLTATLIDGLFETKILRLNVAPTVAPGTYSVKVTATGGGITRTATVKVHVHRFLVSVDPQFTAIATGEDTSVNVTLRRAVGFTSAVSFSIPELPSQGVSGSFSPSTTTGNSTTLTLHASRFADPVESLPLTIRATSGSGAGLVTETTPLGLEVFQP